MRKKAKLIPEDKIEEVKSYIFSNCRYPERDWVMFLFSRYSGLRACEIANITWEMVLDANKGIGNLIELQSCVTKGGYGGGIVAVHPKLKEALEMLPGERKGPIIKSERKNKLNPHSIVNMFKDLYTKLNLYGCTSHSGRRTFITTSAKKMKAAGASIIDLQRVARHSNFSTTREYIEADSEAMMKLVLLQ